MTTEHHDEDRAVAWLEAGDEGGYIGHWRPALAKPALVKLLREVREDERKQRSDEREVWGVIERWLSKHGFGGIAGTTAHYELSKLLSAQRTDNPRVPTDEDRQAREAHFAPAMEQMHKVWTAAVGTPGYIKTDWQELERRIYVLVPR